METTIEVKIYAAQVMLSVIIGGYHIYKAARQKSKSKVADYILATLACMTPGIWLLIGFMGFLYLTFILLEVIPEKIVKH
jgi:hypothetical protein